MWRNRKWPVSVEQLPRDDHRSFSESRGADAGAIDAAVSRADQKAICSINWGACGIRLSGATNRYPLSGGDGVRLEWPPSEDHTVAIGSSWHTATSQT